MKVLVISLAGNGDTLFASPLIHELRLHFPDAEIDALVMWPGARDLLSGNPHLNTVLQKNLVAAGALGAISYIGTLRKRYDITINPMPQSRQAYRLVARLIGAPVRISHDYGQAQGVTRLLVNRTLPLDYSAHCIDNNLALLKLLDAKPLLERHDYELYLSKEHRQWAEDFVTRQGLDPVALLGIHVGSGGTKNLALRRWPLPYYARLIRDLLGAERRLSIVLMGGPDEEKDNAQLLAEFDPRRVFAPRTQNLCQAAALIARCRLFLSVDTVLMNLAAAVKVPGQIIIETPTWNKTVEPYGRPYSLVPNPAVAGKNLDFYRYDGRDIRGTAESIVNCMKSVSVESASRSVLETLRRVKA
ncbi:MAG TPA: glycosyltransferase family 9 protein [Verrucomicrobiae bacterium]|nr:glycosyltransferase family 9 protein [Verrucomicrobiae bacterium]